MRASALLSIIGRIHPEAWDAIIPHGPRVRSRWEQVMLNPQPLPPRVQFAVEAAEMAHAFVRIAVEADVRGESGSRLVQEWVEDWCGTPWPRKWPWPWPGPRPDEGPQPDPWDVATGRAIGAIIFASIGSRLDRGDLGGTFLDGAERLAEAATAEQ
jgi:hypothetical protein